MAVDWNGRYLALLAKQTPIESCFIKALPDHLNAEVSSGTVTTVEEASTNHGDRGRVCLCRVFFVVILSC